MHSEKVDYKSELYKPLLEKGLMNKYFLILPMSERYMSSYINELLNDSDVVICDLTKFNFLANYELKQAIKLDKKIYYFIKEDDKNIKKYKKYNITTYRNSEEFVLLVQSLLDSLNHKELFLERDNIFCLGKVVNNKYN